MSDVERRYHENGKLRLECPLNNGLRHGECKEYYESGALRSTSTYRDGLLEGPKEMLYENGQRMCRVVFRQGRVVDSFVPVFGRDGVLRVSEYWENGRCRGYDQNNHLCREYGLFNCSYDGVYREFYEEGRVSSERFYNAGELDGFAKDWSRDGLRCQVIMFIDGEEVCRKRMEYYENGMLSREIDVNGALPDGLEVTYHENGNECTRMVYELGIAKDGPVNYRDEDGQSTFFSHWENNVCKTYSEDGELLIKATYYRDMQNGLCVKFGDEGPQETYYFDDEECETKEEFLERTFGVLGVKLARSVEENVGLSAEFFKNFYAEQYEKIMRQPNANEEFHNYRELLDCPKDMEHMEFVVRQAAREFMLRLRLPNDGDTEERVVRVLQEVMRISQQK